MQNQHYYVPVCIYMRRCIFASESRASTSRIKHLLSASVVRLNHSLARRHVENQVAGLMANLEMMLDEAMTTCSGKAYSLSTTPTPVYKIRKQCHFALRDFVKYACRPAETSKSCTFIFDVHYNVPELGIISSLCERLQDQDYSVLPPHLRPGESMPPGTTVSYIIKNMEDGVLDLLRILSFPAKTQTKEASAWCTGIALVPAFRQGPWTWVKAVHYLIDMLPGHHVVWWQLSHSPQHSSHTEAFHRLRLREARRLPAPPEQGQGSPRPSYTHG